MLKWLVVFSQSLLDPDTNPFLKARPGVKKCQMLSRRNSETLVLGMQKHPFLGPCDSWPFVPPLNLARASRKSSGDVARDWFACRRKHQNRQNQKCAQLSLFFDQSSSSFPFAIFKSTPLFSKGKASGQSQLCCCQGSRARAKPNEVGRTVRQGTGFSCFLTRVQQSHWILLRRFTRSFRCRFGQRSLDDSAA